MESDGRCKVLRARGVISESVLEELLRYTESPYLTTPAREQEPPSDLFWQDFLADCQNSDALSQLEQIMPQLRFPVATGMRDDPSYREATLRGGNQGTRRGLGLENPADFRVMLHDADCGAVPVFFPKGRNDFRTLVQAIMGRNEPIEVPDSMGACVVAGYNNWGRIRRLKARFLEENRLGSWSERFSEIRKERSLYTDEFFIISDGPYSGVSHSALGLEAESWYQLSSRIRLHHETFHLFCRRVYGLMQTNALDETFADYMGLIETLGRFNPEWFLLFMGLEGEDYRDGGRLQNYCKDLSKPAFQVVCALTRDAGHRLATLETRMEKLSTRDRMAFLLGHDLVDLAEGRFL